MPLLLAKLSYTVAICLVVLVGLLVVGPFSVIQEVRRSNDERLPDWMGRPIGRKVRFCLVVCVLGCTVFLFAMFARFTAK